MSASDPRENAAPIDYATEEQYHLDLGREIAWEVEIGRPDDPYVMGLMARVRAGDGFTQNDRTIWRRLYEQRWCTLPASFPLQGKEHLVPCTLGEGHDGACVPAQHLRDHDCERNGCPQ